MLKIREKMGNFISLHPRTTTALFSVGLTLGIGLVVSYVPPTHDAFAALISKKMLYPMIMVDTLWCRCIDEHNNSSIVIATAMIGVLNH